jgi:hypothetical protein
LSYIDNHLAFISFIRFRVPLSCPLLTTKDFEFAQRLFGEINCAVLGPLGDGKVIVIDDSDEEKEAQEEKTVSTEPMATSAVVNPASTFSVDTDDDPTRAKTIIVMIRGPIKRLMAATAAEVTLASLRPPHRRPRCGDMRVSRTPMVLHCYFSISFVQGSWDGDAKSSGYFDTLHV